MRGTFKRIEVKRGGGVQARRWAGSLKLLQDLHNSHKALWTCLRSGFFMTLLANSPTNEFSTTNGVLFL